MKETVKNEIVHSKRRCHPREDASNTWYRVPEKTDLKIFSHLNINDSSRYKSSYHDG